MDPNKPISGELAAMLPVLAQTMDAAIRSLRQTTALGEVLLAKGVVTKAELDAAMKSTDHLANSLRDTLKGMNKEPD